MAPRVVGDMFSWRARPTMVSPRTRRRSRIRSPSTRTAPVTAVVDSWRWRPIGTSSH